MTNPKLDTMRAGLETEIKAVDEQLATLRAQKAGIAEQIKAKVTEQYELRSALTRLTPRRRKTTAAPAEAVPEA
jgi:predicted nuclease with TOPRIM domain